jgi:hypothetical protein
MNEDHACKLCAGYRSVRPTTFAAGALALVMAVGHSLEGTQTVRGQPRTNTFHHPEQVLCDKDDDL